MRTNDLVSLYVSFVETNGGKSRPVLIRRVSEQTVEAFKITSQYEKKSAYIKQQYYPIQDWQSAGLKKPFWVDLGNIYRFPKAGLNFKEIGHLSKLDQNKISDFTLDLKSKRRGNSIKWLLGLIAINIVGLILITIYSAYYSFGTMLFGVHTAAAVKDFWNTEYLLGTIFIVCFNLLAIITAIVRYFKK